jgi:hypothetical protein
MAMVPSRIVCHRMCCSSVLVCVHRRLPDGVLADGGLVIYGKSVMLGVWAAPGGFRTIRKGGGEAPRLFGLF